MEYLHILIGCLHVQIVVKFYRIDLLVRQATHDDFCVWLDKATVLGDLNLARLNQVFHFVDCKPMNIRRRYSSRACSCYLFSGLNYMLHLPHLLWNHHLRVSADRLIQYNELNLVNFVGPFPLLLLRSYVQFLVFFEELLIYLRIFNILRLKRELFELMLACKPYLN